MLNEPLIFLVGFLVGLSLALLIWWWRWNQFQQKNQKLLSEEKEQQKRLQGSLTMAQVEISALKERAAVAMDLKEELGKQSEINAQLKGQNAELQTMLASQKIANQKTIEYLNQRVQDLNTMQERMKQNFVSISNEALLKNADMLNASLKQSLEHFFKSNESDRKVAHEGLALIMNPLRESLVAVENKVVELESKRLGAYASLKEQIDALIKSQGHLQKETQSLAQALNAPTIRGRWGEMQLRRVVELSGMSSHCDFLEQQSLSDGEDLYRPDMIVTLPKNKKIVIDAKVPLEILGEHKDGMIPRDEQRGQDLAAAIKRHLLMLKKKAYHSVVGESPEFVVMFLPGEAFLHWALLADPGLIDYAAQNEVIIATPITLVALLKAISFGFKQEALASNIEEVRRLSQQLIDRIETVSKHFDKLGRNLHQANESYKHTLASLDSRVLVTARKLAELKSITSKADESESV